jgi:hypothetical protein
MKGRNKMLKYEIKFYDNGTLLTSNSDDSLQQLKTEFNRLSNLEVEEIRNELGLNNDLTVTYIMLMNNKTGKILKEHMF